MHKMGHRGAHAVDRHKISRGKATRYRFAGSVMHRGRLRRQRLGFRGNKVVEIGYFYERK